MPHVSFLGIPVSGDITAGEKRVKQRPLEELGPLMQALLDDPGIEWFGWRQYTPYFNDGDPCVFSVSSSLAVKVTRDTAAEYGTGTVTCSGCKAEVPAENEYCGKCGWEQGRGDDDEDEELSWEGVEYSGMLGKKGHRWNEATRTYENLPYEGPDEARYDRCKELEAALGSGAFDDVLLESFGDHATVIVRKDRIQVQFYSHD